MTVRDVPLPACTRIGGRCCIGGRTVLAVLLLVTSVVATPGPALGQDAKEALGVTSEGVAALVEKLRPLVVRITVQKDRRLRVIRPQVEIVQFPDIEAVSGIVLDGEGHVVTVSGPLSGADRIVVEFADGSQEKGQLVHVDRSLGLGVVKVEPREVASGLLERLAQTEMPVPGRLVVTLGHGRDVHSGVRLGVVSGVAREFEIGGVVHDRLLQLDTTCGDGDRGGLVADVDGRVLGVIVEYVPRRDAVFGSDGMAPSTFAVPMARVREASLALIRAGDQGAESVAVESKEPWIGIRGRDVDDALRRHLNLTRGQGVLIEAVVNQSPAQAAGLEPFDIILEWQGERIGGIEDLAQRVGDCRVGTRVELAVLRAGRRRAVTLEVSRW